MVRELVHDPILLSRKSQRAGAEDLPTLEDLLDTFRAHRETCVGMAANMIGVTKRILVFDQEGTEQVMLNPEILSAQMPYDTRESCLSLLGGPRPCRRYQKIKVRWQTPAFQTRIKTFSGFTAQIIQHEMDHFDGVLI